ncbi:hypothetical protein [Brevundimonas sp. R86498]
MNRSSTPKGSAPVIQKPVHIPNKGLAEAPPPSCATVTRRCQRP